MIFCTLFNGRYLAQGLALYQSLASTARDRFVLYVLCMDDFTAEVLARLKLPNLQIIRLAGFENDELRAARANRSFGEYCWTCTAPLMMHVQNLVDPGRVVAYVDADIQFLFDPQRIFDELGAKNIFIHEHDFTPAYRAFEAHAGRFNVGVVAIRNNPEGRECLARWHRQGLAECVMDIGGNKCGDQRYLDEWPQRYPGLVISANPGVGLAPWNIEKHTLAETGQTLTVDGVAAVFYHFHSLRVWRAQLGMRAILATQAPYSFGGDIARLIYAPYVAELKRAISALTSAGIPLDAALEKVGIARWLTNLGRGRLQSFARFSRPRRDECRGSGAPPDRR